MEKAEFMPTRTTTNNAEKQGVLIKGKDVIMLDAPAVLPSPDTPLLTEAQDIVGAINELKKLSSGEGGEKDWQPPEDWLDVPEPEPWEAYFLIELNDSKNDTLGFQFSFCDPQTGSPGIGKIIIDWGDGNIQTFDESEAGVSWYGKLYHIYSQVGQYLIKVTADEKSCCLSTITYADTDSGVSLSFPQYGLLIAKLGKNICPERYKGQTNMSSFYDCKRLHWVKINGNSRFSIDCFSYCTALKKPEFAEPITYIPQRCFEAIYTLTDNMIDLSDVTEIGDGAFEYCRQIKNIYLPRCTKIGRSAFQQCTGLESIYAPNCTEVADWAFSYCTSLSKAVFADGCTFGSRVFSECFNLYPRPDGTTKKDYN